MFIFYPPFWILMAVFLLMAFITIKLHGFRFIDLQLVITIIAVSLVFDMVFCKWLDFYGYVVTTPTNSFYSLMFCLIGYPAIGLTFIKFLPSSKIGIVLSILLWSAALTIIEEFYAKPYGVVLYGHWVIIPDSPIIYLISLSWEYGYYQTLKKYIPSN